MTKYFAFDDKKKKPGLKFHPRVAPTGVRTTGPSLIDVKRTGTRSGQNVRQANCFPRWRSVGGGGGEGTQIEHLTQARFKFLY